MPCPTDGRRRARCTPEVYPKPKRLWSAYSEELGAAAMTARTAPNGIVEGEDDMTKARARERAKAHAAQKTKKRDAKADGTDDKIRPGQFDPGAGSIKSPAKNTGNIGFPGARRGAARSR